MTEFYVTASLAGKSCASPHERRWQKRPILPNSDAQSKPLILAVRGLIHQGVTRRKVLALGHRSVGGHYNIAGNRN